jgi:hypothetical protein
VEQAQKAFPNAKPRSMVVVLEEVARGLDHPSVDGKSTGHRSPQESCNG